MLHEEVKKYRELSGDTNPNTSISSIGGYLDGYEKAMEQKTGQWIASDILNEKYVCSECGGACWYYDHEGAVAKSKYCPNCGAKMMPQPPKGE